MMDAAAILVATLAVLWVVMIVSLVVATLCATYCWKSVGRSSTSKTRLEQDQIPLVQWGVWESSIQAEELWDTNCVYNKACVEFKSGAVIVDCAANSGLFVRFAAQRCKGKATIVGIEPVEQLFEVMQRNAGIARDKYGDGLEVIAVHEAVGAVEEDGARFVFLPNMSIWSCRETEFSEEKLKRFAKDLIKSIYSRENLLIKVIPKFVLSWAVSTFILKRLGVKIIVQSKVSRLDSILNRIIPGKKIDLLKLDIHESEKMLNSIERSTYNKIQQIVLEADNQVMAERITNRLEELGFVVELFYLDDNFATMSQQSMIYASKLKKKNKP